MNYLESESTTAVNVIRPMLLGAAAMLLLTAATAAQGRDVEAKREAEANRSPTVEHGPRPADGSSCDSIDISGVASVGLLGDPANTVILIDYSDGTCPTVDEIGWLDVVFTANSPSWGSEASLQVSASDGSSASSIQFFPDAEAPGTFGPTSGTAAVPVVLLDDQILRLEFWENFDDGSISPDGVYENGSIEITSAVVPVELQLFSVD